MGLLPKNETSNSTVEHKSGYYEEGFPPKVKKDLDRLISDVCVHPRQSWYIAYFTIAAIKGGVALTQYCQMRNFADSLDQMPVSADMTEFLRALKNTYDKFQTQDNCIYMYINTAFIFVMVAGNYLHFAPSMPEQNFCKRTSGYYQQLHSISFLLVLFGYAQSLYYLVICLIVVGKKCCGEEVEEQEEE